MSSPDSDDSTYGYSPEQSPSPHHYGNGLSPSDGISPPNSPWEVAPRAGVGLMPPSPDKKGLGMVSDVVRDVAKGFGEAPIDKVTFFALILSGICATLFSYCKVSEL